MFFAARLLSFLPFGNILRGPFGKIIIIVGLAIILWIGAAFWLHQRDNRIKQATLVSFNNSQYSQTIKDNTKFSIQVNNIKDKQLTILSQMDIWRSIIKKQSETIIKMIQSGNYTGGPSSAVLKETVKQLSERSKVLKK